MASIINTNSLSLLTQNNLNKSQGSLNTAIQRLSSGLRINSAKDDAAGQAIANRFTSNIKGLTQASRNANDGISLAQTTESALSEINTNLQRIRELAVQSSNGTNSAADKTSIQAEIKQRLEEIGRTTTQTDFNGTKVLNSGTALKIQVGANDGQTIDINLQKTDLASLGLSGFNVDGNGSVANAAANVGDLNTFSGFQEGTVGAVGSVTGTKFEKGSIDPVSGATAYNQTVSTVTRAAVAEKTVPFNPATNADVYSRAANNDIVTFNGSTVERDKFTVNGTGAALRFNSTETTNTTTLADGKAALTPSSGVSTGEVTIGANAVQKVKIDSDGKITSNDGDNAKLYVDSAGNLSKNNANGESEATVDLLLTSFGATKEGSVTLTSASGSTTTVGNTVLNTDNLNISRSLSTTDFQTFASGKANSEAVISAGDNAGIYDISGTSVTKGGDVVSLTDAGTDNANKPSTLTTASSRLQPAVTETNDEVTVTYSLKSNGTVFDASGNQIFKDSDPTNTKNFTTAAANGVVATDKPLEVLDAALSKIDAFRGDLGAVQNRFDSVISSLGNTITNLASSRSRIEDADYAVEASNLTRANILQQAGTSVLAQANQSTQGVLSLLR